MTVASVIAAPISFLVKSFGAPASVGGEPGPIVPAPAYKKSFEYPGSNSAPKSLWSEAVDIGKSYLTLSLMASGWDFQTSPKYWETEPAGKAWLNRDAAPAAIRAQQAAFPAAPEVLAKFETLKVLLKSEMATAMLPEAIENSGASFVNRTFAWGRFAFKIGALSFFGLLLDSTAGVKSQQPHVGRAGKSPLTEFQLATNAVWSAFGDGNYLDAQLSELIDESVAIMAESRNPKDHEALKKGELRRPAVLKALLARAKAAGVGNFRVYRLFSQEFIRGMESSLPLDFSFTKGSAHGVDTHLLQLVLAINAVESVMGPGSFPRYLKHLSRNGSDFSDTCDLESGDYTFRHPEYVGFRRVRQLFKLL